ncbi:MAG: BioY protein [Acidobacteria bacterium]|nr:BioY protein [Acidobacteriota bacterium]
MQNSKAITIPAAVVQRLVRGRVAADMLLVIGASVLVAISAQIAIPIPFSPVPLTLQPLAVLLVGVVLGSTRAAAALALYLLEGVSGLPVFAQGHAGPISMLPTAGYLFSYPAAAWIAGWFSERGWGNSSLRAIAGMLTALAIIYLGGWSWLSLLVGPQKAFAAGVAPFLIADAIKIAVGAAMLPQAQKLVSRI